MIAGFLSTLTTTNNLRLFLSKPSATLPNNWVNIFDLFLFWIHIKLNTYSHVGMALLQVDSGKTYPHGQPWWVIAWLLEDWYSVWYNKFGLKNVNFLEFGYYVIWDPYKKSPNIHGIGSLIREIDLKISDIWETQFLVCFTWVS